FSETEHDSGLSPIMIDGSEDDVLHRPKVERALPVHGRLRGDLRDSLGVVVLPRRLAEAGKAHEYGLTFQHLQWLLLCRVAETVGSRPNRLRRRRLAGNLFDVVVDGLLGHEPQHRGGRPGVAPMIVAAIFEAVAV